MGTTSHENPDDRHPQKESGTSKNPGKVAPADNGRADNADEGAPEKTGSRTTLKAAILVIIPLVAIAICLNWMANATDTIEYYEDVRVERSENMTTMVPVNISYSEYLDNLSKYDRKTITLEGHLNTGIRIVKMIKIYEYYIVDDYGKMVGLDNIEKFSFNFPENGTLEELHSVRGTFRRVENTMHIDVADITTAERAYTEKTERMLVPYTTQVKRVRTGPRYPSVRNLVYRMLGKETG